MAQMSVVSRVFTSAWGRVAIVLTVGVSLLVGAMPANALTSISRSNYIVRVLPGTDVEVRNFLTGMGDIPTDEIDYVFDGFIVKLADFEASALKANKNVVEVIPDQTVSLLDTDSNPPSWGLDRLDQAALPLDNSFTYPGQSGSGVRVYIVDTGVQADNPDFAGRILPGFDVIGTNSQNTDCHGHGTHVAGTAAGTRYGIAKQASIVPVRVLNCNGSGSFSGIITALDWIKANNPAGTPAVVNMSIGGGAYGPVDAAVNSLVSAGIVAAVAAGNYNTDACTSSPAAAASAITVGASDQTDARAYFSNYGSCVDIFAPGMSIVSDNASAPGSSTTMSGTSMATPHVTGAAALVLGQHPTWTPDQVLKALQDNADKGVVTNSLSTNDGLLNISFLNSSTTPAPVVGVPDAPTAVAVSAITQTSATVGWVSPAMDGGAAITGYQVDYRSSAATAWTSTTVTGTTATLTGLTATTVYQVQVSAINSVGASVPSPIVSFTTIGNLPSAPTNAVVTQDHGNYVRLGWTAPTSNGGNAITSYTIQQLKAGVWTTVYTATTNSGLVSGLTPLTAYSFKIWANNVAGASPAIDLAYTTGPLAPATPTVTLSQITSSSVVANWTASAQTDPNYPVSYEVTYGVPNSLTPVATYNVTTPTYTLSGLRSLTNYWIRVQALAGKSSSGANYVSFATIANVPTAPYWLSTVRSGDTFNLNWAVSASGGSPVIDYKLQSSNSNASTAVWTDVATPTAQTYTVPVPGAGQTVYYRVAARNAIGLSDFSLATSVSGPTTFASAPLNFVATPANNGLTLTWDAPASNGGAVISYYAIKYSRDNGTTWTSVSNPAGSSRTVTLTINLPKGQVTLFSIAAVNSVGVGPVTQLSYSPAKTKSTAPTSVTSVLQSSGKYVISWTAPADNGGSVISTYLVQTQDANGNWNTVVQTPGTVTATLMDLGGSGSVAYVRVIAVNEVGQSDPSTVLSVSIPFKQPSAPQNLTVTPIAGSGMLTLSWSAPANLFGGSISLYAVQYSTNGGVTWVDYPGVGPTSLSTNVPLPPKGATYKYRVQAVTQGGASPYSNVASYTRDLSIPTAPGARSITLVNGNAATIGWNAPLDLGGTTLSGYIIEQYASGAWTEVARVAPSVTSYTSAPGTPGQALMFHVIAYNSVGVSPASSTFTITVPLNKPAAPTNVTVSDANSTGGLAVTWTAPTDLGGATAFSYRVETSVNNGSTWTSYAVPSTATSLTVARPAKGTAIQIRVVTVTNFGRSDSSNVVSYSSAVTAPSAPLNARVSFNSDGAPVLVWSAPGDNGGSAITGYLVEVGLINYGSTTLTWSAPVTVAGNVLSFTGVRAAPGSTQAFRVTAVNANGNSPVSNVASIGVPLLKPAAPTNVTVDDTSAVGALTVKWTPSADLGGVPAATRYQIEASVNAGTTWNYVYFAAPTATSFVMSKPAKGNTFQIRVVTITGYGRSDSSNVVSYSVAATAPGLPTNVRASFGTDGNPVFAWGAPSDLGGSPLIGFIVEFGTGTGTSTNAITWSAPVTVAANVFSAVAQRANPGVYQFVRVTAVNAIGNSAPSSVIGLMVPLAKPSAPLNVTATPTTGSNTVTLSWQVPANLGGAIAASYYQVDRSSDNGGTWSLLGSYTATSAQVTAPAKNATWLYRVAARTAFGLGDYSNSVAFTTPASVPGSTSGVGATLISGDTSVIRVVWNAPADNGGSPITGYRIEKSENGMSTWTAVGATDGNTRQLDVAPSAPGLFVYFRVYAVTSVGMATTASVNGLRMPYVAPAATSAPVVTTAANSTTAAPRIMITWTPSASYGGSTLSFYSLQVSTDGTNWVTWANTTALNWYAVRPAAGTTLQYRVVTYTAVGMTTASAVTTVTH
jgi:subtilisin family serine protease